MISQRPALRHPPQGKPRSRVSGTFRGPLLPRQPPRPSGPRAPSSPPLTASRPCWTFRSPEPHTMRLPGNGLESKLCGIFVMAMTFREKTVTSSSFCRFCNPSQPATDSFMNFYSFGSVRERYSREHSFLMDLRLLVTYYQRV